MAAIKEVGVKFAEMIDAEQAHVGAVAGLAKRKSRRSPWERRPWQF